MSKKVSRSSELYRKIFVILVLLIATSILAGCLTLGNNSVQGGSSRSRDESDRSSRDRDETSRADDDERETGGNAWNTKPDDQAGRSDDQGSKQDDQGSKPVDLPTDVTDGLTRDIRDLIPDEMLQIIIDIGMPIYGGNTPPDMTGTFRISPVTLLVSNFDDEEKPGRVFVDDLITFSEQDNESLTIKTRRVNAASDGGGIGGFIVGTDMHFTIFAVEDRVSVSSGNEYRTARLYSGIMSSEGIIDWYSITLMLDEGLNPTPTLLRNGQARLTYDADGFSERTG